MFSFLDDLKLINILKNAFFTMLSVAEQTVIFHLLESYLLLFLTLFVTKLSNCRIILTILGAFIDLKAGIWGRIIEGLGALNDKFMNRLIG
jgi:hypothetical protein